MPWKYKFEGYKGEHTMNVEISKMILDNCKEISSSLELGAGTGQISKLLKDNIRSLRMTLIDSSKTSFMYMSNYFKMFNYQPNMILGDLFECKYEMADVVFSGGLIEHFEGNRQQQCCDIHKRYANKYIAIIVPYASQEEIAFSKTEQCKKLYGYQKPMIASDVDKLIEDDDWSRIFDKVFYKDKLLICIYYKHKKLDDSFEKKIEKRLKNVEEGKVMSGDELIEKVKTKKKRKKRSKKKET